ncbi:MAG: Ig-like domain-containing protein [Nitrospirae bacterium]|nr:Ig-like domain-containing protein [Nitrospirota bacterium]
MKKVFNWMFLLIALTLIAGLTGCGPDESGTGVISAPDNQGITEADSQDSDLPVVTGATVEEMGGGKKRVIVTFNEAMDPASADSTTVMIKELTDNNTLGAALAVTSYTWETPTKLNIDLTAALDAAKDYVLVIIGTSSLTDAAGQPIDGNCSDGIMDGDLEDGKNIGSDVNYRLTFNTGLQYDLLRPQFQSMAMALVNNDNCLEGDRAVDTKIAEETFCYSTIGADRYYAFSFNKFMDPSTINSASFAFSPAIAGSWYVEEPVGTAVAVASAPAGKYFRTFYFKPTADLTAGSYTLTVDHDLIKGKAISGTDGATYGYLIAYTSFDGEWDGPTDNKEVFRFYAADDTTKTDGPTVNGIVVETSPLGNPMYKRVKIYFATKNQDNDLMDTTTLTAENVVLRDGGGNFMNFTIHPDTFTPATLGGASTTVWILDLANVDVNPYYITIKDGVKDAAGNKLNGDGDLVKDDYDYYNQGVWWTPLALNNPVILGATSITPTTVATGGTITYDATVVDYDDGCYDLDIEIYKGTVWQATIDNIIDDCTNTFTDRNTNTYVVGLAPDTYTVRYTLYSYDRGGITTVRETTTLTVTAP